MNKKIEIIANICLTIIGLSLGIIFYLTDYKELSLIMFSIALACILYQFLGGIGQNNSFQMGAVKFGGAAAILIGFMFFLKQFIFTPDKIEIPDQDWFPISIESGKAKKVEIKFGNKQVFYPKQDISNERSKHEYQISQNANGKFNLQLKSAPKQNIGFIEIDNIHSDQLFNQTSLSTDDIVQVFKLYPYRDDMNSSMEIQEGQNLPFEIKVNTSRFDILPHIKNREVVRRSSFIIPVSNQEFYLVILEQANSNDKKKEKRYSKWIVKKLKNVLN